MGKMKMLQREYTEEELLQAEKEDRVCCEICDKLMGPGEGEFDLIGGPFCEECKKELIEDGNWITLAETESWRLDNRPN